MEKNKPGIRKKHCLRGFWLCLGLILAAVAASLLLVQQKFPQVLADFTTARTFNFQGLLRDQSGVYVADGCDYQFIFEVFNQETGGTALWTETQGEICVSDGVFNVSIGSVTPVTVNFAENQTYWLQITVDDETLSPRSRIGGTAYAINSELLDGMHLDEITLDTVAQHGGETDAAITLSGTLDVSGTVMGGTPLIFEGTTVNGFQSSFSFTDPTADRTITFQDASGTIAYLADVTAGLDDRVAAGTENNSTLRWDTATDTWAENTNLKVSAAGVIINGTWQGTAITDSYIAALDGSPTQGMILYYNGSAWSQLAAGTSGRFLMTQGIGADPTWNAVSGMIADGTANNNTLRWDAMGGSWTENANFTVTSAGLVSAGTWNGSDIDISDYTNLVAGNNITLTGDTLDVDDVFLLNSGDTGSGNYDFTGAVFLGASPLVFEGATPNDFETTFTITEPTADNVITFQNATGTVAFASDIVAYSAGNGLDLTGTVFSTDLLAAGGLQISGGDNELGVKLNGSTLSTDASGLKIADTYAGGHLSVAADIVGVDDDFLLNNGDTGTGTYDFTGAVFSGASPLVFEGLSANESETTFTITDPTADNVITFQNATGTVAFTADIPEGANYWTDNGTDLIPNGAYASNVSISSGTLGIGATYNAAYSLNAINSSAGGRGVNIAMTGLSGSIYGAFFTAISGGISTSTNYGLYATASGGAANYAGIFEAGNVGIGDTAPTSKLAVSSGTLGTGGKGATFTATGPAGESATGMKITYGTGIMTNGDTQDALAFAVTTANHTGTTNSLFGINLADLGGTADAEANEFGINIGTNWDRGINIVSSSASGQGINVAMNGTSGNIYGVYATTTGTNPTDNNIGIYTSAAGASSATKFNHAIYASTTITNGVVGSDFGERQSGIYSTMTDSQADATEAASAITGRGVKTGNDGATIGIEAIATDGGALTGATGELWAINAGARLDQASAVDTLYGANQFAQLNNASASAVNVYGVAAHANINSGTISGTNYGVYTEATSNDATAVQYGLYSATTGGAYNTALYGNASGTATVNLGMYATAYSGTANYAAVFDKGLVGIGFDAIGAAPSYPSYRLHIDDSTSTGGQTPSNLQYAAYIDFKSTYTAAYQSALSTWNRSTVNNQGQLGMDAVSIGAGTGATGYNLGLNAYATGHAQENTGVAAQGSGGAIAYGIYATAVSATANWAGYFSAGDVYSADDLFVGASTVSGVHASFSAGGDDLFVLGDAGVAGNVYAETFVSGDTSTTYGNGTITATSTLAINTGGQITVGDNGDAIYLDSSDWDISTTGAISGADSLANSAAGLTITGGAASTWSTSTGLLTLQGGTGVTVDSNGGNLTLDAATGSDAVVTLGGAAGDDFTVDSTTLVVESDNDKVGIGTAAPSGKLDVTAGTLGAGARALTISATGPAAAAADEMLLTYTAGVLDGNDTQNVLAISITSAGHSGAGNMVYGVNLGTLTSPSANAIETAFSVQGGWDLGYEANSSTGGITGFKSKLSGGNVTGYNASITSGVPGTAYGVDTRVTGGATTNYAVYAQATTATTNWAGYFTGNNAAKPTFYIDNANTGDDADAVTIKIADAIPSSTNDFISFQDGSASPNWGAIEGNGAGVVAYQTSGADFAENFEAGDQTLAPGDLVTFDLAGKLQKAATGDSPSGIISTAAGFIGGHRSATTKLVGLAGAVPTKVNDSGGAILPGDRLSASVTPGVGKKASAGEDTVGVALESLPAGAGTISVFIDKRNAMLGVEQGGPDEEIVATSLASALGNWSLDRDGVLTVRGLVTEYLQLVEGPNKSVGEGTIAAATAEASVSNASVTANSNIQLTFYGSYAPATQHWIAEIVPGQGFTVGLDQPTAAPAEFKYLIIN